MFLGLPSHLLEPCCPPARAWVREGPAERMEPGRGRERPAVDRGFHEARVRAGEHIAMKGCPGVARRTTSGGTSAPHWTSPTGSAAAVARLRTVIHGSRSVLLGTLHEHAQARQGIAQIRDTSLCSTTYLLAMICVTWCPRQRCCSAKLGLGKKFARSRLLARHSVVISAWTSSWHLSLSRS